MTARCLSDTNALSKRHTWVGVTFARAIQFAPLPALAATAGTATDVRNYLVKIN